jgi:hypothetical protein
MKKTAYFLFFIFWLSPFFVMAQVGIGTLDLVSKNEGLLVPRMTTADRDLIVAPATGLLIYNTSTSSFNFFDNDWKDYSEFAKNYKSNLTGDIFTTTSSNDIVIGMSITPPFAGKYKVTFNSYFNNAPIIIGPFSTLDCTTDLLSTYNYLNSLSVTKPVHAVVLGHGEVLTSGVYDIAGATSTVGTIYFDGEGNPDALFVIRISAAFATGAASKMVLLNGAKAANIFWVVQGAAAFAESTELKGTVITYAGTNAMAAGGNLEGRLLAITGAVSFSTGIAIIPLGNSVINLGFLSSFVFFSSTGAISNASTSTITGNIGANTGAISGLFLPTVFKGSLLNSGEFITTLSPNNTKAIGTFGIYQNGVLIPSSNKTLTSNANSSNISLQAIATILPNQAIDVRWNTNSEKIVMGNRTLTLIRIQ